MKKLLLLALLAGCTSAPVEDPTHKAISALLQKNMNDPASYQPVRWSKPEVFTIHDSIAVRRYTLVSEIKSKNQLISIDSISVAKNGNRGSYAESLLQSTRIRLAKDRLQRDSLYHAYHQDYITPDTARLGYYITHAFRSKNKVGAVVLDSVEFYINRKGAITAR